MDIVILDIVKQCYSQSDGQKVYDYIYKFVEKEQKINVSFERVDAVPSSFVNSAFIQLLEHFDFEQIKRNISFTNTSPQINEMIKKRFKFEVMRIISNKSDI